MTEGVGRQAAIATRAGIFFGGMEKQLPIPNATPQEHEATGHSYYFLNRSLDEGTPEGRWTSGLSLDGRSEFTATHELEPLGQKPNLGKARLGAGAQEEQE